MLLGAVGESPSFAHGPGVTTGGLAGVGTCGLQSARAPASTPKGTGAGAACESQPAYEPCVCAWQDDAVIKGCGRGLGSMLCLQHFSNATHLKTELALEQGT